MGSSTYTIKSDSDELARFLRLRKRDPRAFVQAQSFLSSLSVRAPVRLYLDIETRNGTASLTSLPEDIFCALVLLIVTRSKIKLEIRSLEDSSTEIIDRPFVEPGRSGDEAGGWLPQFPGVKSLTPREYQVLTKIVAGASSKQTAAVLGMSPRTVEVHRAHIMKKLGVHNTVELLHAVLRLETATQQ